MNTNAVLIVVIALVVVCLLVAAGLLVWWLLASKSRRDHESTLRTLGDVTPHRGAEPFSAPEPFTINDTVRVTPLSGVVNDYERLAAEAFKAPPGVPLGQSASSEPFSWTAAVSDSTPLDVPAVEPLPSADPSPISDLFRRRDAVPETPSPTTPEPSHTSPQQILPTEHPYASSYAPTHSQSESLSPKVTDPMTSPSFSKHVADLDDDLDQTTVVRRAPSFAWNLVLPDGTPLSLETNNVIGRRPAEHPGAHVVTIVDETRTLSKTHARLWFDGEGWIIEDLASTNGVVLLHADGREQEIEANQPVFATPKLLLGTLLVELREGS